MNEKDSSPSSSVPDSKEKFRDLLLREANYDPCAAYVTPKRSDYLSWEDYFMAVAFLSAQRSKDPSHQVGACIVDSENRIVGIGYNGFPRGCNDDYLPWAAASSSHDTNKTLHTKYPFMCHAEINAILNKCSTDVKGAIMYVIEYPGKLFLLLILMLCLFTSIVLVFTNVFVYFDDGGTKTMNVPK